MWIDFKLGRSLIAVKVAVTAGCISVSMIIFPTALKLNRRFPKLRQELYWIDPDGVNGNAHDQAFIVNLLVQFVRCSAQAAMARFDREWVKKDGDGMEAALAEMRRLMTQGASDWAAWRVIIGDLIESKRKLVDTEQKRITLAHESLTADRAMLLLTQVVQILQRHITDRRILGAIAADIQGTLLMGKRDEVYEQVGIGPHAAD